MPTATPTNLDALPTLGVMLDASGTVVHWNAVCARLLGIPPAQARGRLLWDLLGQPAAAHLKEKVTAALYNKCSDTFTLTCSTADGEQKELVCIVAPTRPEDLAAGLIFIAMEAPFRAAEAARLPVLLEQAPDGIFVADLDGRYTDVNQAGCALLGYSRDELLGKTIVEFIPEQDAPRLWAARQRMLEGGVDRDDWTLLRKDGSRVAVEVSAKILADGRWQAVVHDISTRQQLEESLRLSNERLKVALQASPAIVFNQDRQLRYTWIHDPHASYTEADVLGKTDHELLPGADAARLTQIKRQVLSTGMGTRATVRTTIASNSYYYDLAVEPLKDPGGNVVGITCATWDVTEQQRAAAEQRFLAEAGEALLKRSRDHEATLNKLSALAVTELAEWFIVDLVKTEGIRRLHVACADPAKQPLAQAMETVPLDRSRPHLMAPPLVERRSLLLSNVNDQYLHSVAQNSEHLALLKSLQIRSMVAVPLLIEDELLGAMALLSSRDSRRYSARDLYFAEELARLAALAIDNARLYEASQQAIAARERMLGVVGHDLRSPLHTVLLQLERLERQRTQADPPVQQTVDVVRRAVARMNRLVHDMVDFASLEAGAFSIETAELDPQRLLQEAYDHQWEKALHAHLELRLEIEGELPCISADADRLLQVLDNLLDNAIKFTPSGGRIVLGAAAKANEILFWVTDTGYGIAEEHIRWLFAPFWQSKPADRRGVGLGLPIVQGIIAQHGGRIWVDSKPHQGATFYFLLPVAGPSCAGAD